MFEFKVSLDLQFDFKEVRDTISDIVKEVLEGDSLRYYITRELRGCKVVDESKVSKEVRKRVSTILDHSEIKFERNIDSYMTRDDARLEINAEIEDYIDEIVSDACYEMNKSLED